MKYCIKPLAKRSMESVDQSAHSQFRYSSAYVHGYKFAWLLAHLLLEQR